MTENLPQSKSLDDPMDPDEIDLLAKLEAEIREVIDRADADAGARLLIIRDERLYREKYLSWDGYTEQEWGFTGSTANRMIVAAEVTKELGSPVTQRQALSHRREQRALTRARVDPSQPPETPSVPAQRPSKPEPATVTRIVAEPFDPPAERPTNARTCDRCDGRGWVPERDLATKRVILPTPKGQCKHPPGRRIGDWCAECESKVGTPDRRFGR